MSGKTTVMKPGAAIAACFGKFARCYGRSCRAEFIWFLLFFLVLGALAVWFTSPMIVGMLWALLMIPLSSVGIRRLHDLNLPGGIWTVWLTITVILPMFGLSNYMNNEGHLSDYMLYLHYAWLFVTGTLLLFLCFASGQEGPNKYGPAPCVKAAASTPTSKKSLGSCWVQTLAKCSPSLSPCCCGIRRRCFPCNFCGLTW